MEKVRIENNIFVPMPVAIVGTVNEGRPNYMAAGWVTRANASPPLLAVGIHKSHLTHDSIIKTGSFSLSFPGKSLLGMTDYVGLVSGNKTDKSDAFVAEYGEDMNAPLIVAAALCLECRLTETVRLPSNTLFIAEITAAWCTADCLTESGAPDFRKADCCFLTMPDNTYWGLGEPSGKAWEDGKKYFKS